MKTKEELGFIKKKLIKAKHFTTRAQQRIFLVIKKIIHERSEVKRKLYKTER